MRKQYNIQLKELHDSIAQMGCLCEEAISLSLKAMSERAQDLAEKVFSVDADIDRYEREIEAQCMKLILQQQPIATDLREISATLKLISDMERIGDQASDIAEIVMHNSSPDTDSSIENDLKAMADDTVKMVTDSIESFLKKDTELGHAVIKYDDRVDDAFVNLRTKIVDHIAHNSSSGEYCLDIFMIAKYLERIGDHATNIAEWAIYAATGVHEKN